MIIWGPKTFLMSGLFILLQMHLVFCFKSFACFALKLDVLKTKKNDLFLWDYGHSVWKLTYKNNTTSSDVLPLAGQPNVEFDEVSVSPGFLVH